MESALLLDVVVGQGAAVLKLLPRKDQTLLIRGDTLLILDLGLDPINRVGALDIQGDVLPGQGLNKDLHATAEAEDQVESALLLDVVVGQGAAVLKLLPRKDQTLLIRGDALLVLDLGLNSVDGVGALNIQSDVLASQSLDENLHCYQNIKN